VRYVKYLKRDHNKQSEIRTRQMFESSSLRCINAQYSTKKDKQLDTLSMDEPCSHDRAVTKGHVHKVVSEDFGPLVQPNSIIGSIWTS
jgi:hypothetical protein